MRYVSRTQRIDICWPNEQFNEGIFRLVAGPSHYQGAGIYPKACVDKVAWNRNLHPTQPGGGCDKTIVADHSIAEVFSCSGYSRVIALQTAPGYSNRIVRVGKVEGVKHCYVALALNGLTCR